MTSAMWMPGLDYGAGHDSVRGEARQTAVQGTLAPPVAAAGQQGDSNLLIVQSATDFDQIIGIDAEIGTAGLFSGNAKFSFKQRSKVSSQATFCILRVFATNAFVQLQHPQLTPEAVELLKAKNTTRFRERFGDQFVSGLFSGCEFYGSVRIESRDVSTQTQIATSLQASYAGFAHGDASVHVDTNQSSSEHRIEVMTYQKGGEVNICVDVATLFAQAKDALDKSRTGQAYPFAVEMTPYRELALPDDSVSLIDVEFARRALAHLASHQQALERISNDIDFVLRNQAWFANVKVPELNDANAAIASELTTIRDKADACSRDVANCTEYAPKYPAFVMPERVPGAPMTAPPTTAPAGLVQALGSQNRRYVTALQTHLALARLAR